MRLDNERPSDNIEDRRGQGGGDGFGLPGGGGGGFRLPMGRGGGGMSLQTIILLVAIYLIAKFVFGVDLLSMLNGGGQMQAPPGQHQSQTQLPAPGGQTSQNNQNTGGGQ